MGLCLNAGQPTVDWRCSCRVRRTAAGVSWAGKSRVTLKRCLWWNPHLGGPAEVDINDVNGLLFVQITKKTRSTYLWYLHITHIQYKMYDKCSHHQVDSPSHVKNCPSMMKIHRRPPASATSGAWRDVKWVTSGGCSDVFQDEFKVLKMI